MLGVPYSTLQGCLQPDVRSVEEPLTYTLGKSEEEIWEDWDWDQPSHDHVDSLRVERGEMYICDPYEGRGEPLEGIKPPVLAYQSRIFSGLAQKTRF